MRATSRAAWHSAHRGLPAEYRRLHSSTHNPARYAALASAEDCPSCPLGIESHGDGVVDQ